MRQPASVDQLSDPELLDAWAGGDLEAGDTLVQRHFVPIFRFLRRRVGEDAKDLTQRTFLACVEACDSFRRESSFRSYVFGIARRQLLMAARKRGREDSAMALAGHEHSSAVSPGGALAMRQEQRMLVRALASLPDELQVAVELYYWEGMSAGEVAAVFDVPTSTLTSRLARARELLRQHILDQEETPGALRETTVENLDRWVASVRMVVDREGE